MEWGWEQNVFLSAYVVKVAEFVCKNSIYRSCVRSTSHHIAHRVGECSWLCEYAVCKHNATGTTYAVNIDCLRSGANVLKRVHYEEHKSISSWRRKEGEVWFLSLECKKTIIFSPENNKVERKILSVNTVLAMQNRAWKNNNFVYHFLFHSLYCKVFTC